MRLRAGSGNRSEFILITDAAALAPVAVDWEAARSWLLAELWEAMPLLPRARQIAADRDLQAVE
jgi:hypothetical protein